MPDTTPDTRLQAALARANQYTHKAIEKPDDAALYEGLAQFVIECMEDPARC